MRPAQPACRGFYLFLFYRMSPEHLSRPSEEVEQTAEETSFDPRRVLMALGDEVRSAFENMMAQREAVAAVTN